MPTTTRPRSRRAAKPSASTPTTAAVDASSPASAPTSPRQKLDPGNLYDLNQVKRVLDDELISLLESRGHIEAVFVSNVKIICGTLATIAAVYSHFNPWEYPANRSLMLLCVTIYFICMALMHLCMHLFENAAIFVSHTPTPLYAFTKAGTSGTSLYEVTLRRGPRSEPGCVRAKWPYERYFTCTGNFLAARFRADLLGLVGRLDNAGKTKPE